MIDERIVAGLIAKAVIDTFPNMSERELMKYIRQAHEAAGIKETKDVSQP